jgi:hypothetical protein
MRVLAEFGDVEPVGAEKHSLGRALAPLTIGCGRVRLRGLSMSWWIYKCNAKRRPHQRAYGDWNHFFQNPGEHWGSSKWVPALADLKKGDLIIAYQTDRNLLVGLAKVRQPCGQDPCLYLDPIETMRIKVRPLKQADPRIAAIPALQPGPIRTIYEITESDARRLLVASGAKYTGRTRESDRSGASQLARDVESSQATSAGFGDSERNKEIEAAAIEFVTAWHRARRWTVRSVENSNCGYDLRCEKAGEIRHVEVKGVRGDVVGFMVTAGEVRQAKSNSKISAMRGHTRWIESAQTFHVLREQVSR